MEGKIFVKELYKPRATPLNLLNSFYIFFKITFYFPKTHLLVQVYVILLFHLLWGDLFE